MALILKLKLKGNYFEKQCRKTLLENVIFENKTWSLISWQLKQQKYTLQKAVTPNRHTCHDLPPAFVGSK